MSRWNGIGHQHVKCHHTSFGVKLYSYIYIYIHTTGLGAGPNPCLGGGGRIRAANVVTFHVGGRGEGSRRLPSPPGEGSRRLAARGLPPPIPYMHARMHVCMYVRVCVCVQCMCVHVRVQCMYIYIYILLG